MSGLCGIVSFDGSPVDLEAEQPMVRAAAHRVLDDAGVLRRADALLVELSSSPIIRDRFDHQPLIRAGLIVVADARIDNRQELVPSLRRKGYLTGDSDTTADPEIIIAAHRCWGDLAPAHFIGDFAYALWDYRSRRLVAARDPMGMRPFYYRLEAGRRLLFASELKQLLSVRDVPCRIDEVGIATTIAGPYLPTGMTLYSGVDQLAPGHILAVDRDGPATRRYWAPNPESPVKASEEECGELIRAAFVRAVEDRMRSSRAIGISLSGGVDSGSIASTAGWLRDQSGTGTPSLHAYSWAFPTMPDSDERTVSDLIVARYRLNGVPIFGDDAWPLASYPDHGPDRDDPFIWPYQELFERTVGRSKMDGVTVYMSGDRGDELLGDWVFDELGLLRSGRVGIAVRELAAARGQLGRSTAGTLLARVARPLVSQHLPILDDALRNRRASRYPTWPPWVPNDFARRTGLADIVADARRPPRFDGYARSLRYQRIFSRQSMRIATLGERTAARFGVGFADPFADRRLVSLVLALPQWRIQTRRRPKHLARVAMRGIVPEDAGARMAKTVPLSLFDRGLRDRAVDTARELLTNSRAADHGWLDATVARAAYERYVESGHADHDFWWPLVVEWWLRRWWE